MEYIGQVTETRATVARSPGRAVRSTVGRGESSRLTHLTVPVAGLCSAFAHRIGAPGTKTMPAAHFMWRFTTPRQRRLAHMDSDAGNGQLARYFLTHRDRDGSDHAGFCRVRRPHRSGHFLSVSAEVAERERSDRVPQALPFAGADSEGIRRVVMRPVNVRVVPPQDRASLPRIFALTYWVRDERDSPAPT